jgi:hypothetical protein
MGEIRITPEFKFENLRGRNCLADGNLNRRVNFPCNIPHSYFLLGGSVRDPVTAQSFNEGPEEDYTQSHNNLTF